MPVIVEEEGRRRFSVDDPKDTTPEIARILVAWLCRSPIGVSAVQQAARLFPPPAEVREAGPAELIREGVFVRPEYVRCNKRRCKNDEHGPYWYCYRRINGRWKREYVGRERPKSEAFWTISDARKTVEELLGYQQLNDEQISTLRGIANAMGAIADDADALEVEQASRRRLLDEERFRTKQAQKCFEQLLAKARQPGGISTEEAQHLQRLADWLSFDH